MADPRPPASRDHGEQQDHADHQRPQHPMGQQLQRAGALPAARTGGRRPTMRTPPGRRRCPRYRVSSLDTAPTLPGRIRHRCLRIPRQPGGPAVQVALLRDAGAPPGGLGVRGAGGLVVPGHLQQVGRDRRGSAGARRSAGRRRARPAGPGRPPAPSAMATATTWFSATTGLSDTRAAAPRRARGSASSPWPPAVGASSCRAAMAAWNLVRTRVVVWLRRR